MPDSERTDAEILAYMGTDAAKWTDEFMRIQAARPVPPDWGAMVSWFANAIEAGRSAGMKAVCPHTDVWRYGGSGAPNPLVLCNTCGASHDTLSDTWA